MELAAHPIIITHINNVNTLIAILTAAPCDFLSLLLVCPI